MIKHTINLMDKEFQLYINKMDYIRFVLEILMSVEKVIDISKLPVNHEKIIGNFDILLSYLYFKNKKTDLSEIYSKYKEQKELVNSITEKKLETLYECLKTETYHKMYFDNDLIQFYNILKNTLNQIEIIDFVRVLLGNKYVMRKGLVLTESEIDISDLSIENMHCIMELNEFLISNSNSIKDLIDELSKLKSKSIRIALLYKETEERLLNNDNVPIDTINEKGKNYFSNEILYNLYLIIHQNQVDIFSRIDLELMKQTNTSLEDQIVNIFKKFHLSLDMLMNKELIIKYGYASTILHILQDLKSMDVNLDLLATKGLEYILCFSNPNISSQILRYRINGYIDVDFIESNLEIFITRDIQKTMLDKGIKVLSSKNETIEENVKLLKNQIINPNYLPKILLNDSIENEKASILLQKYDIKDMVFYNNYKLFDLVDLLIEIGIDPQSIDYSNVNGYDIDLIIKRLFISSIIGLSIIRENKISKSIITGEGFLVEDDKLDDYIIDESSSNIDLHAIKLLNNKRLSISDNELTSLSEYYDGNNLYNFDGIMISKIKILRNLASLSNFNDDLNLKLTYAIIYNSFLKQEDIDKIKKIIKSKSLTIK